MEDTIKSLAIKKERIKRQLDFFQISDNLEENQNELNKIENLIKDFERDLEEAQDDLKEEEDLNSTLIDKFKEQKADFEVLKINFKKEKEKFKSANNIQLLKEGELISGAKKKTEKEKREEFVKIKENQQLFLDDAINKINLLIQENKKKKKKKKEKKEIKYFDNIVEPVIAKEQNEKKVKVEKKFNYKMLSIIFGIIILLLIIVIIIILTLPKNSESESPLISDNKGIQFEYDGNIDYAEFNSKKLSFILLKGGESTTDQFQNFKINLEKAKDKNIKIGAYWLIKSEDETEAINEANTAYNFLV